MSGEVKAHILHEKTGLLGRASIHAVPRAGDEIRMSGERYLKVTRVIWIFDEPDSPQQRVNIGVVDCDN